ncbi:pyocin knob domain-containing protein [Paenibacillus sp. FSL R5-0341]|uniref:pyocin knob domain-containing protein n=1 Tax=Paenibacillus sp. FSL R5-0341 TaxID=2921636 RepID=UPI0030CCDB2E
MPQETDRLKLPLPLGNERVTRDSINMIFEKIDAGVATQADLDAKPWQKYALTQDTGLSKRLSIGINLDELIDPGQYTCDSSINGPIGLSAGYIEVIGNAFSSDFMMQRVTDVLTGSVYVRVMRLMIWESWVLQTPEENLWGAL